MSKKHIARALFAAVVAVLIYLNITGFCYNQFRYLSDEEIMTATLKDWDWYKTRAGFKARGLLEAKTIEELTALAPVYAQVSGRRLSPHYLFRTEPGVELPPQIFRAIGAYRILGSIIIDTGQPRNRYHIFFRKFHQCGAESFTLRDEGDHPFNEWKRVRVEAGVIKFVDPVRIQEMR